MTSRHTVVSRRVGEMNAGRNSSTNNWLNVKFSYQTQL